MNSRTHYQLNHTDSKLTHVLLLMYTFLFIYVFICARNMVTLFLFAERAKRKRTAKESRNMDQIQCFRCKQMGHYATSCPARTQQQVQQSVAAAAPGNGFAPYSGATPRSGGMWPKQALTKIMPDVDAVQHMLGMLETAEAAGGASGSIRTAMRLKLWGIQQKAAQSLEITVPQRPAIPTDAEELAQVNAVLQQAKDAAAVVAAPAAKTPVDALLELL